MGEPGPAEEVVQLLAATAIAAVPAAVALPSRTITIVVPTAAGGGNDAMARTIAQQLGQQLYDFFGGAGLAHAPAPRRRTPPTRS